MLSRCCFVFAGLLAAAGCTPEPVPPQYPVGTAQEPPSRHDERQLATQPPEPPADHSEPGEAKTQLGTAPSGTWLAADGSKVSVKSMHTGNGAIIVFYRGSWCKSCRTQLSELSDAVDEFKARGFKIHAISTDSPEKSKELLGRLSLKFQLYSDVGGFASQAWGVYSREHDLARPAVFIVTPGGAIAYRFLSDTPSDRPKVSDLLDIAAKAMKPENE